MTGVWPLTPLDSRGAWLPSIGSWKKSE